MTDIGVGPGGRRYEGKNITKPYPHEEFGPERGRADDPVKYIQSVEQRSRERLIAYEMVRILRRRAIDCYEREGTTNAYEACRKEAFEYFEIINKKDFGQLHPDWKDPKKHDGW